MSERRFVALYPSSGPIDLRGTRDYLKGRGSLIAIEKNINAFESDDVLRIIQSDNNEALGHLLDEGAHVDTFLALNDGCKEGGNYECVNSVNFFGRLMPILANESIYVTDHELVGRRLGKGKKRFLNVPIIAEPINDVPDIAIKLRPDLRAHASKARVWNLTLDTHVVEFEQDFIAISTHRDSIFRHCASLDALYLQGSATALFSAKVFLGFNVTGRPSNEDYGRCSPRQTQTWSIRSQELLQGADSSRRFLDAGDLVCLDPMPSIERVKNFLRIAATEKATRVGMSPLGHPSVYQKLLGWVKTQEFASAMEIHFFHMNRADFPYLYALDQ